MERIEKLEQEKNHLMKDMNHRHQLAESLHKQLSACQ